MRDLIWNVFLIDRERKEKKNILDNFKKEKEKIEVAFLNLKEEKEKIENKIQVKEKILKNFNLDLEENILKQNKNQQRIESGKITNSKELLKIEQEINFLKQKQEKLETEILETLEEIDCQKNILPEIHHKYKDKNMELKNQENKLKEEEQKFENFNQETEKKKLCLLSQIDEDLIEDYQSLKKRKKTPVALVLKNECQECFIDIPKEKIVKLRETQDIIYCDSCDRILYLGNE